MKKYILPFLPLLAIIVGVVAAFGTGGADEPTEPVVLDEEDLMEQVEIWRNQYRRMTPGDGPLVQDVGELPAAWEEFGNRWSSAPAERDLATWLVSFSAERQGDTTVIRDADGAVLWSGTTDFAMPGSTNVTITGALVDEADWPFYDASRWEVFRRLDEMDEMHGGIRGTNGPYTNGLRFTNIWMETNGDCRLDLAWESNGVVEVFCRAMHTETWTNTVVYTNDENQVVTNEFTYWRQLDTFHGIPDDWVLLGTTTITNGSGSFTDTNHVPDYDRVKFYAAAALADFDDDGLSDGQEWLGGTSWDCDDSDQDGLDDWQEAIYGTNPMDPDSDKDGIGDGQEVNMDFDPTEADGDRDGLNDWWELYYGTEPDNSDSDEDGMPDGWEVENGLDPTKDTGVNGPDGDPDADGFPNLLEFELEAPANNPAWNGHELAWKLMHVTPVVTTNNNTVTTNLTGLLVEVEDSSDCVSGGNSSRQDVTTPFVVPDLLDCGYYIEVGIAGSVEDVDANFDKVYFNAYTNNFYFSSHDGIPDSLGPNAEECRMVDEYAVKTNLVFPNSTIGLRYDTAGYKWHYDGYAQVVSATCVSVASVEIEGPNVMVIDDTAQMTASEAGGGPYTWSVSGEAATITSDGLLTAVTTGVAVVTASNAHGCISSKEVEVVSIDLEQIIARDSPCNQVPNPKQTTTNRLFVATDASGQVNLDALVIMPSVNTANPPSLLCAVYKGNTHLASAPPNSEGRASLSFIPTDTVQTNIVRFGIDDNGNDILDVNEFLPTTTYFDVVSFTDAHYEDRRGSLGMKAGWAAAGPYNVGATLLYRFLSTNSPPPSPFNAISSIRTNCAALSSLSHNAGATFDAFGYATLAVCSWNASSEASQKISNSDEMHEIVNRVLTNHTYEVLNF